MVSEKEFLLFPMEDLKIIPLTSSWYVTYAIIQFFVTGCLAHVHFTSLTPPTAPISMAFRLTLYGVFYTAQKRHWIQSNLKSDIIVKFSNVENVQIIAVFKPESAPSWRLCREILDNDQVLCCPWGCDNPHKDAILHLVKGLFTYGVVKPKGCWTFFWCPSPSYPLKPSL